jgi:hypothetical protein
MDFDLNDLQFRAALEKPDIIFYTNAVQSLIFAYPITDAKAQGYVRLTGLDIIIIWNIRTNERC